MSLKVESICDWLILMACWHMGWHSSLLRLWLVCPHVVPQFWRSMIRVRTTMMVDSAFLLGLPVTCPTSRASQHATHDIVITNILCYLLPDPPRSYWVTAYNLKFGYHHYVLDLGFRTCLWPKFLNLQNFGEFILSLSRLSPFNWPDSHLKYRSPANWVPQACEQLRRGTSSEALRIILQWLARSLLQSVEFGMCASLSALRLFQDHKLGISDNHFLVTEDLDPRVLHPHMFGAGPNQ